MDARGGQGRAGSRGPDLVAQFGMVSLPGWWVIATARSRDSDAAPGRHRAAVPFLAPTGAGSTAGTMLNGATDFSTQSLIDASLLR